MKDIIDFASKTVDLCVKCDSRSTCKWFGIIAENVILDDITPEEYANLTYEEIATRIHENAGDPICGVQRSLDEILETVEGMIEHAVIPNFSQELIELLNKMARLEKRLKRLPDTCRDVFDAIVRAIVERCLSAIDYYYLNLGLDIYPLIQNIHADYRRTKMLHQYYLEGVVNVLLSQARKLTLDQIVSWKEALWQLKNIVTESAGGPEQNSIPDTDDIPEAIKTDDWSLQGDESHFVIFSSVMQTTIKTINPHPVTRSFINYLTSSNVVNYIKAFSMSFGFDPSPEKSIDDFFDTEFISQNITPRMDFEFDNMPGIYKEITQEVRQRKKDEGQLHLYICALMSELSYIGLLLFPRYNDFGQQKRYMLFDLVEVFHDHSREKFSNAWAEAMTQTESFININHPNFYSELVEALGNELLTSSYPEHDRSLTGIKDLRNLYRHYIAAIEAALLINKVEHNCLYYGLDVGACFTRKIPYDFIPGLTGLSQHAIVNLSNNLGHNVISPGQLDFFRSTYPDLEEEENRCSDKDLAILHDLEVFTGRHFLTNTICSVAVVGQHGLVVIFITIPPLVTESGTQGVQTAIVVSGMCLDSFTVRHSEVVFVEQPLNLQNFTHLSESHSILLVHLVQLGILFLYLSEPIHQEVILEDIRLGVDDFLPSYLADSEVKAYACLQEMVTQFVWCAGAVEVLPGCRSAYLARHMQTVSETVACDNTIRDSKRLLVRIAVTDDAATSIWNQVPLRQYIIVLTEV